MLSSHVGPRGEPGEERPTGEKQAIGETGENAVFCVVYRLMTLDAPGYEYCLSLLVSFPGVKASERRIRKPSLSEPLPISLRAGETVGRTK